MKKVYQDKFGNEGNCFDACVASILELDLKAVPHFINFKSKLWIELRRWLNFRGYDYCHFPSVNVTTCMLPFVPIIVSGNGGRGFRHAVIKKPTAPNSFKLKLLHDPHPEGNGLTGKDEFYLIIFRNI